jgi:hypothetical protein
VLHGWANSEHVIITTSTKELWLVNATTGNKDVTLKGINMVHISAQPRMYFDTTDTTATSTLSLLGDDTNERIITEGNDDDHRLSCYLVKSLLESKDATFTPEWTLSAVTTNFDGSTVSKSVTIVAPHYLVTFESSSQTFVTYNLLTGHAIRQWSYIEDAQVRPINIEIDEVYATSEWILVTIADCLPDTLLAIIDSYIF